MACAISLLGSAGLEAALASAALWKRKKNGVKGCWEDHSQHAFLYLHSVLRGSRVRLGELSWRRGSARAQNQRRACVPGSPVTCGVDVNS